MSYRTITINQIQVIGRIWMPYGAVCAQCIDLTAYDIENIGELTRDNVEQWLMCHSGDFSSIIDFRADIGDFLSEWADEESECTYSDCMYPAEE